MKKRILLVLLAMLVGMTMIMTACGGGAPEEPMTLEKYVQGDASVEEAIDSALNDSNVLVEIKENSILYTFDLSTMDDFTEEAAKSDEVAAALMSALDDYSGTFGSIAKSIEDETGIAGISTVVSYTWGDEVVATRTFTSADAPASAE